MNTQGLFVLPDESIIDVKEILLIEPVRQEMVSPQGSAFPSFNVGFYIVFKNSLTKHIEKLNISQDASCKYYCEYNTVRDNLIKYWILFR